MGEVKGYKIFNHDWTCRGFKYKVGKIFEEDVVPLCCKQGFHFCLKASDCFDYYSFSQENRVAEVIALGDVDYADDGKKCCTNRIHIIREIPWEEVLRIANEGKGCNGLRNTGDYNTGNHNTGNCNAGYRNTGNYNTGDYNTGNYNAGDYNTGNCNTGNYNTGDWNNGACNTGCFNTREQKIIMFDKPSDWTYSQWIESNARYLLNKIPTNVVEWVCSSNMTDEEKASHPTHEKVGGYLKILDESERAQIWWDGLWESEREIILNIPNFDPGIFMECTGINVGNGEE